MLTRWLTFTAFLAGSANPERAVANGRGSLTVAPTCRVKGHPEAELTLNCGDGKKAGVVQYWHTPFGDLQTPGLPLDPVFIHRDGSLKVPNTSILHSGLYYCLLQHTEGTTLWPYELHVGPNQDQKNQEHSECKECDVFRFRRDVGSVEARQVGVSDGQFAGAVAASVLLTFVVGFSAGALTRTHVLRCLGVVTTRLRSPRQQQRKTNSEVTMTTLPPIHDNQTWDDDADSTNCSTMETTTTLPANPQRSLRHKRQEERETTAYLEGCDYMKEEEAGRSLKENNEECNGEAEEGQFSGLFILGEDVASQTETNDDKCSKDKEGKDGRESREDKKEWRQDEVEEAGEQENRSNEDGERRGSEEEEKRRDEEDQETDSDDEETGSNKEEDTMKNNVIEGGGETVVPPGRRRRVIRLYQYDEEGQRFGHLPSPATNEPGPAPRLKQRSLSLTRLNTIMATASAGPLDTRDTGRGEREERPHFHMEI